MLKIYALDYYRLQNAEHSALMDFVKRSFKEFPIVPESFPKAVELFRAALEEEGRAMRHVGRPQQSASIHAADEERTKCFRLIRDMVKIKARESDERIVEAAKWIVEVSNAFGGSEIGNQGVAARTTNITVFIERLENDYFEEVRTLKIEPYLKALKEANQSYNQALWERDETDAEFGKNARKLARKASDFALRTLFSLIQDRIRLGEGEEFTEYVKFINVEIDKYRISLGQGPGARVPRRRKKDAEEATETVEIQLEEVSEQQ